jgi:hypothetical protein
VRGLPTSGATAGVVRDGPAASDHHPVWAAVKRN